MYILYINLSQEVVSCEEYVMFSSCVELQDVAKGKIFSFIIMCEPYNPYPTAFPYGNGMVLHFYQQQESSMTKTVHKVINKGLKTYV